MEDRSNPSKEWNVSVLQMRNLGYMENIVRADIQKGSCRKTVTERDKGRENTEDSQNVRGLGE